MDYTDLNSCVENYNELTNEFKELENVNKEYLTKLEELGELQSKCVKEISHQRYRLDIISKSLKKFKLKAEEREGAKKLRDDIEKRHHHLCEMEHCLPKPNGTYLKIILGNVNVSILNKNDKFRYKDEYEKFKVYLSVIGFALSVINLSTNFSVIGKCVSSSVLFESDQEVPACLPYVELVAVMTLQFIMVLELIFMFLLVWYYCTLTIRESILKVNGSKIKGWWRAHHFISTVVSGVLLIWPNSSTWYHFRPQFMVFNVYISFVQFLQFKYQQGVLYRLKALGERHNMDITIEGFHSWMWRGLSFLLPFLYAGYLFQLYNAYTLYTLINHPDTSWQIPVLAALFFTLFLGNTVTTSVVIRQKFHEKYAAYLYDYYSSSRSSHKRHKNDEADIQQKSD